MNNGFNSWNGVIKFNPFGNVLLHQFTSNAKAGVLKDIKGIPSKGLDCNVDYGLLTKFGHGKTNNKVDIQLHNHVKVKNPSTWYNGTSIPQFVYNNIYTIIEIVDDRVVIGINGEITGAIHINNLNNI